MRLLGVANNGKVYNTPPTGDVGGHEQALLLLIFCFVTSSIVTASVTGREIKC